MHPLQAARDLYCKLHTYIWLFALSADLYHDIDMHVLIEAEKDMERKSNKFFELFTVPRNRRAAFASFIVMFMYVACPYILFVSCVLNCLSGNNCETFVDFRMKRQLMIM